MKKKQIGTIFILVITVGLIAAIVYFNVLLNDKGPTSVTQIKKTKASAITYHKLLALNSTPVPDQSSSSSSDAGQSSSAISQVSSTNVSSQTSLSSSALPTAGPPLTQPQLNSSSSQSSLPPLSQSSSAVSAGLSSQSSFSSGYQTIPTATPALLAYRTVTVSPTLIPSRDTGVTLPTVAPTKIKSAITSPTIVPTGTNKQLPETGWVQVSTIFFIVAVTTVFVSFLF